MKTSPQFVDTHCHLDEGDYVDDAGQDERMAVLERAREAGLCRFVVIGSGHGLSEVESAVAWAHSHADVFAAVGVHPHHAENLFTAPVVESAKTMTWGDELWKKVVAHASDPRVVAIGETGLDYHYNYSSPEHQQDVFRRFILLAQEVKKPLSLHIRDAHEAAQEMIRKLGGHNGVVHCFTGTQLEAEGWLELGFSLSFSGIVTFKNSTELREVCRKTPFDRLLLETDAPYLAPVPLRGKRNEPAYLMHTAALVAELREISLADLAEQTTNNAQRLFVF